MGIRESVRTTPGSGAVPAALSKAHAACACGADYIANILRRQQQRRDTQPPLQLRDPALNELAADPLSLAEYDAFILRSRKDSRDLATSQLDQLSLTTMSRQLDQTITDATARNLASSEKSVGHRAPMGAGSSARAAREPDVGYRGFSFSCS